VVVRRLWGRGARLNLTKACDKIVSYDKGMENQASKGGGMEASELRRRALEARKALPPVLRLERSEAIWKRLLDVPAFQRASQALFFVSHGSEVETLAMRRLCRERGVAVAVPRCDVPRHGMSFHSLGEPEALLPGAHGILEPAPDAPRAVLGSDTVVLVPGSVFDRQGRRLGMGGGYYDRWLSGEGKGLCTFGLAFHEQVVEQVPVESHDVPVQWLITDRESVHCALQHL
jgi:5-formyltetrahydrofolate cyclo-ligase